MNGNQLFVYALVNTIYIPCVATIAVLGRELGWKRAAAIMSFTITLALAIGGIAYRLLALFSTMRERLNGTEDKWQKRQLLLRAT